MYVIFSIERRFRRSLIF